jgi:hypothetical protein
MFGCSHTPEKEYIEVPVFSPVVCPDFGRIEGVKALPVVFVKGTDDKGNIVLGLRGDMYSNLSIVIKDSLRYIGEQTKAINYYEKCIADHNAKALNEEGPE